MFLLNSLILAAFMAAAGTAAAGLAPLSDQAAYSAYVATIDAMAPVVEPSQELRDNALPYESCILLVTAALMLLFGFGSRNTPFSKHRS